MYVGIQLHTSNKYIDLPGIQTEINNLTTDLITYHGNNYLQFNNVNTEYIIFHRKLLILQLISK